MGLLIKSDKTAQYPIDVDFTKAEHNVGYWKFGGTATESLTNLKNGHIDTANTSKIATLNTDSVVFNAETTLDAAINAKSVIVVFDTLNNPATNTLVVGNLYTNSLSSNATRGLFPRHFRATAAGGSVFGTTDNAKYNGTVVAALTIDASNKKLIARYLVNGVLTKNIADLLAVDPLLLTSIPSLLTQNANNKYYEFAAFDDVLSDAVFERYFNAIKNKYARKGIVIN